ncbi:hypothetical protein [Desertivirga brevis]|uniref:hypothetical protein n=1 Tax=Desertivirga brevis TaxID=2810310 RepID=UPI001A965AE0|nr:hypothetical protein [Pedobacter sp. SYSU D00873]
MHPFDSLGLAAKVVTFFEPFFHYAEDLSILFAYYSQSDIAFETFISGKVRSVATRGIWQACPTHPRCVRDLYLFPSAMEALAFFHYKTSLLSEGSEIAAVSTGILPHKEQVLLLKERYKEAKLHLVCPSDLAGRIADCKIALWAKGLNAFFHCDRDSLLIEFGGRNLLLPGSMLSLSSFQKQAGLKFSLRTHKPRNRYNTYYELLLDSI